MLPEDVIADVELLVRFQAEVAYGDDSRRGARMTRADTDLLLGADGLTAVAWLWPDQAFDAEFDPFDREDPRHVGDAKAWTGSLAERFSHVVEQASLACKRSSKELLTHIEWAAELSHHDMSRVSEGYDHMPHAVGVCRALQLEYRQGWSIVDPAGLADAVDTSCIAKQISSHLHLLTAENLRTLSRKLPKGRLPGDRASEPGTYTAPPPGGRYRALYEFLAQDDRDAPRYRLEDLDRALVAAGESPLPATARTDRSWWAGTVASATGRPQVTAWWAAGYRVEDVGEAQGAVKDVVFRSLPGRSEWLTDPRRAVQGSYQLPEPERVRIRLQSAGDPAGVLEPVLETEIAARADGVEQRKGPRDEEVRLLLQILELSGEMTRAEIEPRFDPQEHEDFAPWMSNLLTKARRQGWTVRYGSKTRPRWVAAGSKGDLMLNIASLLGFDAPHVGMSDEVSDEYLSLVANALGVAIEPEMQAMPRQILRKLIESLGHTWAAKPELSFSESLVDGLRALRDAIAQRHDGIVGKRE